MLNIKIWVHGGLKKIVVTVFMTRVEKKSHTLCFYIENVMSMTILLCTCMEEHSSWLPTY